MLDMFGREVKYGDIVSYSVTSSHWVQQKVGIILQQTEKTFQVLTFSTEFNYHDWQQKTGGLEEARNSFYSSRYYTKWYQLPKDLVIVEFNPWSDNKLYKQLIEQWDIWIDNNKELHISLILR